MSAWPGLTDTQRDAAVRLNAPATADDYGRQVAAQAIASAGTAANGAAYESGMAGRVEGVGEMEAASVENLVRRVMGEQLVELRRERDELAKVQRQLQVVFRPMQLGEISAAQPTPDGQDVVLIVNRATWASATDTLQSLTAIRERLERSEASCISTVGAVASMQGQLSAVNARLDNLYTLLVSNSASMVSPAVTTRPLAPASRTAPPSALHTPAPSTPGAEPEAGPSRRRRREEEDELDDEDAVGEEEAEPPLKKAKQKRDINAQNAFKKYLRERMALALNDAWPAYPAEGEAWPGTHYPSMEQLQAWTKADPATRGPQPQPEPWLRIDWHKEQTDSAHIVKLVNHFAAHLHANADTYAIPSDRRSIETLRAALKRGYKGIKAAFISATKPHAQRTRSIINAHQRRKRRRDKRRERRRLALQESGVAGAFEDLQAMSEEESEVDPEDSTKRHAVHVRLIRPAFRSKQVCQIIEALAGDGKSDGENRHKGLFEPKTYLGPTHAFMPAKPLAADIQRYQVAHAFALKHPALVHDVSLNWDAWSVNANMKPEQWGDNVEELPIHRPESETPLPGGESGAAGPSSESSMASGGEIGAQGEAGKTGTSGAAHTGTGAAGATSNGAASNAAANDTANHGTSDGATTQQQQQQL